MLKLAKESKFLAKHTLIYSLGNFMQRIVSLLLLPVYTRFLTPHDYGVKELVALSTDVIGILLATAISGAIYRFYFEYKDVKEIKKVIAEYMEFYNKRRIHSTLDYETPDRFYYQNLQIQKLKAVTLKEKSLSV